MYKVILIFLSVLFLFINETGYTQPQFKINLRGGYNIPLNDLNGDNSSVDDVSNKLLMSNGYNFGGEIKYYFARKRNFGITLSTVYNQFTTGDYSGIRINADPNSNDSGIINRDLSDLVVGLGFEYDAMPRNKFNFFAGAEFTANFLSGSADFTPDNGSAQEYKMVNAARFGIGVGLGGEYMFSKNIGLITGAKYHIMNLVGKDTVAASSENEYALIDDSYMAGNVAEIESKNLSYIQLYLGLTFWLGHPNTSVKK